MSDGRLQSNSSLCCTKSAFLNLITIKVFKKTITVNDRIIDGSFCRWILEDTSNPADEWKYVSGEEKCAKDTESVSRYWVFCCCCCWKEQKIMNGFDATLENMYNFFQFFYTLLLHSFLRNDTGRCGIKTQSVKHCLISSVWSNNGAWLEWNSQALSRCWINITAHNEDLTHIIEWLFLIFRFI